jgi:hypothetical protein
MRAGLSDNLSCCTQLWEIPQQKWSGAPLTEGLVEQYELPHIVVALIFRTLLLKDKVWEKDYLVTSNELWSANPLEDLPCDILMFPQVNIDRPHVVHFLIIEKFVYTWKKMWVVTIDMNTKKVESFDLYINGMEAVDIW